VRGAAGAGPDQIVGLCAEAANTSVAANPAGAPAFVSPNEEPLAAGALQRWLRMARPDDVHVEEGQWAEKSRVELPYTPGHENAGWVHELGSAVTNADERRSLVARLRLSRELFGDVLADDFYVSRIDVLPTRGGAGTVRQSSASTCGRGWMAAVGDSRSPRPREMTLR
jgi:hypothetical protein